MAEASGGTKNVFGRLRQLGVSEAVVCRSVVEKDGGELGAVELSAGPNGQWQVRRLVVVVDHW